MTFKEDASIRGTIYKRVHTRTDGTKSALYYGVVSSTDPETKKRRQDWGRGHPTRRDAIWDLNRRLDPHDIQAGLSPTTLQLGPYLWDHWLPTMRDRIEATTYAGYERAIRRATGHLGAIRLQAVTSAHLNRLYAELRESGGRYQDPRRAHERRPLAPGTVRAVHAVLSKAFGEAVELGLLVSSPAVRAKPPRVRHQLTAEPWSAEDLRRFLEFVSTDPLYPIWRLAVATGMRRGELMGVRWEDVDLGRGVLVVRQQPQTFGAATTNSASKHAPTDTLQPRSPNSPELSERTQRAAWVLSATIRLSATEPLQLGGCSSWALQPGVAGRSLSPDSMRPFFWVMATARETGAAAERRPVSRGRESEGTRLGCRHPGRAATRRAGQPRESTA